MAKSTSYPSAQCPVVPASIRPTLLDPPKNLAPPKGQKKASAVGICIVGLLMAFMSVASSGCAMAKNMYDQANQQAWANDEKAREEAQPPQPSTSTGKVTRTSQKIDNDHVYQFMKSAGECPGNDWIPESITAATFDEAKGIILDEAPSLKIMYGDRVIQDWAKKWQSDSDGTPQCVVKAK